MAKTLTLDRVRYALTGPLMSIRTPFNRDGSIDYDGVRRMIDFGLTAGCRTALLTAGDSHFHCMSDAEIREINRVVAQHAAGRALVVGCDWEYATPQALEFAGYCVGIGADILMTRPPDWANSATVDSLVTHYAAVAERIPVMVVTNIFQTRPPKFGIETLTRLRDTVPNIMALKEDLTGDFARLAAMCVCTKWAVFAGGGLRNYMNMLPYGCDGFMDRHMNFAPKVSQRYWNAIQDGDADETRRVIEKIEVPLENFMETFPGGRDAAIHGLLEICGIAGRWRRPPYHSLTDAEMEKLKAYVQQLGLL